MRISIFILLLTAFFTSEAQTHAEEHYEYDRLYKMIEGYYNRGLYHKSALYPDSLEGNKYVNASSNYFFARVHALGNEFDRTLFYLEKAVKQGITKKQIEQMYDLDGFRESHLNIVYEINYDKWHQEYIEKENSLVLDSIYIKEIQKISDEYSINLKIRKVDGDEIIEVKDSLRFYTTSKRLDSLSFVTMVQLTVTKGFPTYRSIGKEFYRYSRYLRYNILDDYDVNGEDWQRVKEMILEEIVKGTIYPFYYAAIEDRIRLGTRQPQLYGTVPVIFNSRTDLSNGIQYENSEELNIRRRAVGLCSIQLDLWSRARELPESLKKIKFK
tara:strand:+ start:1943 stop:2923 length:981 start_codon:yes stop_codon:yes gene_type:complete